MKSCVIIFIVFISLHLLYLKIEAGGLKKETFLRVNPETQKFVDHFGRTITFHGVNVVYKSPPFYPPILDRFDANSSLCDTDFQNLHNWGFNMIRLHIAWEGVEPERGRYDFNYLNVLKNISNRAEKYGIKVLLDAHQDVFNRYFCGEGAPDWANLYFNNTEFDQFPFPIPIKLQRDEHGIPLHSECTKHPFFLYYLTRDTGKAFQSLYDNKENLRSSFAKFWGVVSSHFKNDSNILGYEILNEPWMGDIYSHPDLLLLNGRTDREFLMPMYKEVHNEIRKSDEDHLLFYEPCVSDLSVIGFESGPGGKQYDDRQVLSYHVYCSVNDEHGDPKSRAVCKFEDDEFFKWRRANIEKIGGGSFLTEFGAVSDKAIAVDEINWVVGEAENALQSWAYWQFKYYDDFTTASSPGTQESFYFSDGSLQREKVRALSRTYAPAVCGVPSKMHFDPMTAEFNLIYSSIDCQNKPTVIFLNEEWYYEPDGYHIKIIPEGSIQPKRVAVNYLELYHTPDVKPGTQVHVTITRKY